MSCLIINSCASASSLVIRNVEGNADYEWTVVGAGPAGNVVVGLLIDLGINPQKIMWVDPEFSVGRLSLYGEVPANSNIRSFIDFLKACKAFCACQSEALQAIYAHNPNTEPPLQEFIKPLMDITNYLRSRVYSTQGYLKALDFADDVWNVTTDGGTFSSQRVVLATGSHPHSLNYQCSNEISLDAALNKSQLVNCINENDSVAVIGSAHSAVLVMKFLSEINVARILNFYSKPLQYVVNMGTWSLHGESGLKGIAAEWARNVLEKNPPANLLRIFNTEASRKAWMPVCNKIVYAAGFEPNQLPPINGSQKPVSYDETTGCIAPHLFGIGIAFPELYTDPLGNTEHKVGLNSFMAYAQRIMPEWMNKDIVSRYKSFESLFVINVL